MSENQKNNLLTIIDAEGNEVLCNVLFTYHSDEFNKDYVVFYPISSLNGEDDKLELMAASYTESEDGGELSEIPTDEEWEMIEDVLEEFEQSMAEHDHQCCCHDHDCECDQEGCECDHEGCNKEEDGEEHHCCCGHHHDEK